MYNTMYDVIFHYTYYTFIHPSFLLSFLNYYTYYTYIIHTIIHI